jgi:class 3 adenylate cyclase
VIAESFDECPIVFADIVGFTQFSEHVSAQRLVHVLNALFSRVDDSLQRYGVEKIKRIGDAYPRRMRFRLAYESGFTADTS